MSVIFASVPHAYSYSDFVNLAEQLLAEGKTTGNNQSEEYLFYTRLNVQRMLRWNKTFSLREDLIKVIVRLPAQTWWVITEAWCGDSAQNLPVIAKMAEASAGKIDLKIVLRDEHPEIMDQYLTHGTRSIPIVAGIDQLGTELFRWGPRPAAAQALLTAWKKEAIPRSFEDFEKEMHTWYTQDKGHACQDEFMALLSRQLKSHP